MVISIYIICRSADFRVFRFSRISDFATFCKIHEWSNYFYDSSAIIILFGIFLNSRICPPREIREN